MPAVLFLIFRQRIYLQEIDHPRRMTSLTLLSSRLLDNQAVANFTGFLPALGGAVRLVHGGAGSQVSNNLLLGNKAICTLSCIAHGRKGDGFVWVEIENHAVRIIELRLFRSPAMQFNYAKLGNGVQTGCIGNRHEISMFAFRVGNAFEETLVAQQLEPVGEHVGGDPEFRLELLKPC